ncbi:hypothetical protein M3484_10455 [Pseudomonas sp. GX19020]|uniref:hypothetical protein n=1 Tax=Pseudomonas sp. GX19020 TaxID=2942277 RepID=UPI0020198B9A|nr:hypothetical protein [Pseudomonas sp. GX19020]MCL4066993.1 hypothetical protein [Pseudomonas sp. GX19020]
MADPFSIASGVVEVLGGLKGLFGKKPKNPTPRDNLLSQLQGIEEGAEKYGYNRLTLLQHGQTAGTGLGASGPPLASFDMLSDGFREIGDITSGDADRRRQQENLKLDLAKLEIERLKAGKAADAVGGVSPLGRNASMQVQSNVASAPPRISSNPERTSVRIAGIDSIPDTGWSDAEEIEKRGGDVASWVYGLGVIGADAWNTFATHAERRALKSEAAGVPRKTWGGLGRAIGVADNASDNPREWSAHRLRQEFGAAPDGYTDDNRPFWKVGNGISTTPPNKRKAP